MRPFVEATDVGVAKTNGCKDAGVQIAAAAPPYTSLAYLTCIGL